MLKLEILARHYRLSDREVVRQAQVHVAFRLFVGLGLDSPLPHRSLLTSFRHRVGAQRLQQIFHALLGQARELGLVRDRLRIKDATHVIANIAIPSTIGLVAQTRDQLLTALQPFAAAAAQQEQQRALAIRIASADLPDEERLVHRVAHLRAILAWADQLPQQEPFHQATSRAQEHLWQALTLAHKVLADREPDARTSCSACRTPTPAAASTATTSRATCST
jgi:IS5 family transposase